MILEYLLIEILETLKEWKMVITSVEQGYKSTEGWYDYKTGIGITYEGWGLPMDIGKSKENFKDRKPKCFNCDLYRHMAKDCQRSKKEKNNRKCYKCKWVEYIAKDCRTKQMKNWSVQKETDTEEGNKKQDFGEDPK